MEYNNNICVNNILEITSNGNAIIAELLRLKDFIPEVFLLETKEDQKKYAEIILDFSYFKISDFQDRKIENDSDLQDLDEAFRDNHIDILNRFYLAFESIHQYISDLNNFISELNDGIYIQQTLESVFQDDEGKQLLCESLFLYGVMLLILDLHIPGIIRERLLVSYHRYSSQKSDSNIDDVCKLLRSTGFSNSNTKRVPNYPEIYFKRIPIDETFIEMIIGRLRSEDIYNQITIYPLPEHSQSALATQAGMLYICLFFSTNTLHNQTSRMREIVDKFFSDNWIISVYMGITVNLINSWEPYKAAKQALTNTINTQNIEDISKKHNNLLTKLLPQCRNILKEGTLTEHTLIKNITKVINLVRECNVTLRWLMLHTSQTVIDSSLNKKCKIVKEQVIQDTKFNPIEVFELLLNTSQLELKVRDILKLLIAEKEKRWTEYRQEAASRINDLSEVFSGDKPLTKIEKNHNLMLWFKEIHKEIINLNDEQINISGRKIVQLIQALEEVQEFHNLDTNMQVKQYLLESCHYLHQMIYTINIKMDVLINLQIIADLSYAWHIIDNYTTIMQESIKKQPNLVIKLRATFLKLSSALEIPLLRINQSHSGDLISVSQYYSNVLVNYVRKVVQIIPKTMFDILIKIIDKQTDEIKEIPTRLEKDKLKEYAQLDERFIIAKLTYSISVFTEGILMMKKTLVGVIELDPKQLLEDGIKKELVRNISEALHNGLIFNTKIKQSELEYKLASLEKVIDGYRRSFEYVQDYLNIHGLKIWQEEMTRIINYNVEKECNSFLRSKVLEFQSIYQSTTIPIPNYPSTDNISVNFIGRLAREILRLTDPKTTVYVDLQTAWYDFKTHKELLNQRFFSKITEPALLIGLDKLYSFMIVSDLQKLLSTLQKNTFQDKLWQDTLNSLYKEIYPTTKLITNPIKFYANFISRYSKITPILLEDILKIGQKQILRQHISYELNISCKFNSKNLESSLRAMNQSLLYEIAINKLEPTTNTTTTAETQFNKNLIHCELNKYLETAGIFNPLHKIYTTTKNSQYFSLIIFLFVIINLTKLQFSKNISCLIGKRSSEQIDGNPFIIGVMTVLRQFHQNIMITFIDYLSQYTVSHIDYNLSMKQELGYEAQTALRFLEQFVKFAEISRDVLEKNIPEGILNQYEFLSQKLS